MTLVDVLPVPDAATCRRLLALLNKPTKENAMQTKPLRFPPGPRLRAARVAAGISPEQVAVNLGRSAVSVQGYELGRIEPPIHILLQMCQMFGVSVGDILEA